MKRVLAAVVLCILVFAAQAHAFDRCNEYPQDEDGFRSWLSERVIHTVPEKYFDLARSIALDTKPGYTGLSPVFAKFNEDGRPAVVFPADFAPVICRIALAQFVFFDSDRNAPAVAAQEEAAKCVDAKIQSQEPLGACLAQYAAGLETTYRSAFGELASRTQNQAYAYAADAVEQIAKHEFAHHFLNHFERVKSGSLARIDAEFEADFDAALNAVQTGTLHSAMYYFFAPLGEIERRAGALKSPNYESADCRAANINDISGLFGIVTMVLNDAAEGENRNFTTKQPDMRLASLLEELRRRPPPAPSEFSCGKLSLQVLAEAQREMIEFTTIFADSASVLFEDAEEMKPAAFGIGNKESVLQLIERLRASSASFIHLKGLSARALSIFISRLAHQLEAGDNSLAPVVESVLAASGGDFISGDHGRILNQRAVFILYEQKGARVEAKLEEARRMFERAVLLLPNLSESWANLAIIALATGNCSEAVALAETAIDSTQNEPTRASTAQFRDDVRNADQEGRCSEMSQNMRESLAK
ncbi:MAG: hypothetical protein HC855_11850 [Rhizobiales bacterium]|nr:hypothetical protein [Hyphomicrobiales bacterium]